ncbi:hypothetical protein DV515_00017412, partial [Chloebia gouldiae]
KASHTSISMASALPTARVSPDQNQEQKLMLHSPLRTCAELSLQEPVRPRWLKEMHIPACSKSPVGPIGEFSITSAPPAGSLEVSKHHPTRASDFKASLRPIAWHLVSVREDCLGSNAAGG